MNEKQLRALVLAGFKAGYAMCREDGGTPAAGAFACPYMGGTDRTAWLEGFKHGSDLGRRHWAQYEDAIDVITAFKPRMPSQ